MKHWYNKMILFFYLFLLSISLITNPLPPSQDPIIEQNSIQAILVYLEALQKNPCHIPTLFNLAETYAINHHIPAAINCYHKIISLDKNHAQSYSNLGVCYYKQNAFDEAIQSFNEAIQHPDVPLFSFIYLGLCYAQKKEFQKALSLFYQVQEKEPNHFDAHYYAGIILKKLNRPKAALNQFKKAYTINPAHIKNLLELGNTFNILNKNKQAIKIYEEIIAINPELYIAFYNIGDTLKKQGLYTDAIALYQKSIELKPDYSFAHFGLATTYLSIGNLVKGFQELEWRWKISNHPQKSFTKPIWNGSSLANKTIYIYAEQELNDTLQFVRYLKLIKEQGATIIFEAPLSLIPLLSPCPYIDHIVTEHDTSINFDYHAPLMSLPLICKTTIQTIPQKIPYLTIDTFSVQKWKKKLAPDKNFKIGICWKNDYYQPASSLIPSALLTEIYNSSIPLYIFESLAHLKGVSLYSLQSFDDVDKAHSITFPIHPLDKNLSTKHTYFMGMAAFIKNLDLIISIDTPIAHLAGALGLPVWTLLPKPAHWRWLDKQTSSPWYPTMQLFNQHKTNNWRSVIDEVTKKLKQHIPLKKEHRKKH